MIEKGVLSVNDVPAFEVEHDFGHLNKEIPHLSLSYRFSFLHHVTQTLKLSSKYASTAKLHDDVDVMNVLKVIVVFDNPGMIQRFQYVDFLAHLDSLMFTLDRASDLFCRSCSFWMILIAYLVVSRSIFTSWQNAKPPLPKSLPTACCL